MSRLTCAECLEAEAEVEVTDDNGKQVDLCRRCLHQLVEDQMLDYVNDGQMKLNPDGTFEPTEKWHARRAYEAGE